MHKKLKLIAICTDLYLHNTMYIHTAIVKEKKAFLHPDDERGNNFCQGQAITSWFRCFKRKDFLPQSCQWWKSFRGKLMFQYSSSLQYLKTIHILFLGWKVFFCLQLSPVSIWKNWFLENIWSYVVLNQGVCGDGEKPSFAWVEHKTSNYGVPLLKVVYPDMKNADYLHLKQISPIPKQSGDGIKEEEDRCNFEGHLENEPEVNAFLKGGCPFDDSFVVLNSSLRFYFEFYFIFFCILGSIQKQIFEWLRV